MSIQKFYKLWLEINPYRYIFREECPEWHLETCLYEGLGDYRDKKDLGIVNPGTRWGKTGDTGFFSKDITVPDHFAGYPLVLEIITGGEALVSINGIPYQGNDPNHAKVVLSQKSVGGESYSIQIETVVRRSFNEVGESRFDAACTGEFSKAVLYAVDTEAQEFIYDLQFVLEFWHAHDEYAGPIEKILTLIFGSFDINRQESFRAYVDNGRKTIRKAMTEIGVQQEEFVLWMIGQSHLDLAWFWRKDETYRKVVRTFSSVLRNMEQFDFYRFMMPQVKLFRMLKEASPVVFAQVKQKVMEGKIEIAGLFYVEPDTNLVSGEWLVRQILFGRKFYLQEFGRLPKTESLIDAFGYSGNLPQILHKSGIDAVMVTKMRWYNDTNAFPYSAFLWKGIDGSEILSATMPGFNFQCNSQSAKESLEKNLQKDLLKDIPIFYGWGDGGGGADENHLQGLQRLMEWYKPALVRTSGYVEYFEHLAAYRHLLPKWWGEIYQEGHRGCYTSQAKSKKLNRQSESLYRSLEFFAGLSMALGDINQYPQLQENIELILINQFHDILPGSAVHDVYLDSYRDYEKILAEGSQMLEDLLHSLSRKINTESAGIPLIVWHLNQNSIPSVVRMPWHEPSAGKLVNASGENVPFKIEKEQLVFVAHDLPSIGYEVYHFIEDSQCNPTKVTSLSGSTLENSRYSLSINEQGTISRIFDKKFQRNFLVEGTDGNRLTLYFDYPKSNDAWDIDRDYQDSFEILSGSLMKGTFSDGLKQWITFEYEFGSSRIEQDIILWEGVNHIDFDTRVEWHERHRLLKAEFNLDVCASKAVYDIPFGVIERDTHPNNPWQQAQFEVPALSLADLSEGNYGVTIVSEHKNGFSVKDQQIGLSLLRSSTFPDTEADQGSHQFHYSLIGHPGDFREGHSLHESRSLAHPVMAIKESCHPGTLPQKFSFIQINKENVIIEALKPAEEGNALILRLYETYGQSDVCVLKINFPVTAIEECNLVEEKIEDKPNTTNDGLLFSIKPFEIKTFKLFL